MCSPHTHRELSFVFSLGASLPPFLPNQVTLQLHFRCSHELRTLSETFHTFGDETVSCTVQIRCKGHKMLRPLAAHPLSRYLVHLPFHRLPVYHNCLVEVGCPVPFIAGSRSIVSVLSWPGRYLVQSLLPFPIGPHWKMKVQNHTLPSWVSPPPLFKFLMQMIKRTPNSRQHWDPHGCGIQIGGYQSSWKDRTIPLWARIPPR